MRKKDKFKLTINVSVQGYATKDDAIAAQSQNAAKAKGIPKMAFRQLNITIDELVKYITSGYAVVNLFDLPEDNHKMWVWVKTKSMWTLRYPYYVRGQNKGYMNIAFRKNDFWRGAQCVFVDIDKTRFSCIEDFIAKLLYRPTIGYYTYSDGKDGTRHFRLVYIMDRIYGKEEFDYLYTTISKQIEWDTDEVIKDNCGKVLSQFFTGTTNTHVYLNKANVYTLDDIKLVRKVYIGTNGIQKYYYDATDEEAKTDYTAPNNNEVAEDSIAIAAHNKKGENIPNEKKKEVTPKSVEPYALLNEKMLYDMKHMPAERFRGEYQYRFTPNFFETQYNWAQDEWCKRVSKGHIRLYYNCKRKIKNHEHRRKILYSRMCLRRLMVAVDDVRENHGDINDILYWAYWDLCYIIDNTDKEDLITIDQLIEFARNVFTKTRDEIIAERNTYKTTLKDIEEHCSKKTIVTNPYLPNRTQYVGPARTYFKDGDIGDIYDCHKSVQDNLEIINQSGLKVSKSRLYEWCKTHSIDTKAKSKKKMKKETEMNERDEALMLGYNMNESRKFNSMILGVGEGVCQRIRNKLIEIAKQYDTTKSPEDNSNTLGINLQLTKKIMNYIS